MAPGMPGIAELVILSFILVPFVLLPAGIVLFVLWLQHSNRMSPGEVNRQAVDSEEPGDRSADRDRS
ncbi:hypothetical protein [Stratiformator vulcanicus]|uniref:Uncharacterized protein n=1 Tax=Stratiformator vulcanicus TaxID=2527980 RepID=A0A517R2T5_9PLAN|nr:hypothetical protein [Stratiformator vulcanicus]QDT38197.1 hypothetical protein Pan189_25870 [Stratiformator vulcanicus]